MPVFALAALTPVPLIGLGALAGGAWLWAGFLYMALLSVLLDQLIPYVAGDAAEGQEFPGADLLLAGLALSAMALLLVVSWTIAAPSGRSSGQKILLFCATGLWLGQVGHPAAHELIHRGNRLLFRLGQAFYIAILFGQHASAHRLVHHRYVASDCDPNTAREGESFYHFARRAWIGSWKMGWRAETDLRARARGRPGLHPYAVYLAGGALCLGLALVTGGVYGLVIWILLGLYAQMQVLVSDYVQHYGLRRARLENGRLEPVGPQHSWNTAHWASSALMLNAPRHSDHHSHPSRPYPALRLPAGDIAPRLPWPLPLACCLAFLPGPWRRLMRPHLRRWQASGTAPPGPASPGPASPQVRQS
ncbi:alkane 1-monooxygenase [Pseudogemmobacter faecipullorum]|uniref:Alkane 1-monooxygenase n=1 Tax=Pseudogemmobacter faecipullorum TaxID=2755041 RepID=A0ABS8CME7_9RHOB|nr:alkane 1-monooxygenase [Pseudogemmobacter faecipullorum]MCB5410554.1 alkane 1-monooxygenase [Pseudogemmobacter faecipullorum]